MEILPVRSITKKGYNGMCDFIKSTDPGNANVIINGMRSALENVVRFSPDAKASPELVRKQEARRQEINATENTSTYKRYCKPRAMKIKSMYPNVPMTVIYTKSVEEIKRFAEEAP